jgi:hypothetical protein
MVHKRTTVVVSSLVLLLSTLLCLCATCTASSVVGMYCLTCTILFYVLIFILSEDFMSHPRSCLCCAPVSALLVFVVVLFGIGVGVGVHFVSSRM